MATKTAAVKRILDNAKSKRATMKKNNTVGYIAENGIRGNDAKLYQKDKDAFSNMANSIVTGNEMKAARNGKMYYDYPLLEANRNAKKIQSRKK